ncbi:MAG TPA: hypothetical protein PKV48_03320 [Thermodesulfobacteriota bacterium]|nr:hypothetical protein [Thermodesulfobacteriota bacterium]
MNKKKLVITIGLVFVFAMVAMVTNHRISNAQECKIIRIDEVKGSPAKAIRLDTEKLIVAKGTCVVWINWSGQLVKIVFKEAAQKCSVAMDGQSGFQFVDNCFVSNMVPHAGTSSVRFNTAGTFRYEVVVPPAEPSATAKDKVMATGEIIVE